jgi:hypothetical protein
VNRYQPRTVFALQTVTDRHGERVVVSLDETAPADLELSCDCPPCRAQMVGAPTIPLKSLQRRQRRQLIAAVQIKPYNPTSVVRDG